MADLDLAEAVDAAAQALFRHQFPDASGTWDDVQPMTKRALREIALPLVTAAAPLIAAQARAEALREAAGAALSMYDPPSADCVEWADWLRARAHRTTASSAPTGEADHG